MHQPVLIKEVISSLNLKPGYCVLDATVGGGGHSREILKKILPGGRLIGIDADEAALKIAAGALRDFEGSFKLINGNFSGLDELAAGEGIKNFNAVLFDFGISSYQIEDGSRGFSIKYDAPLDMRMDRSLKLTARDVVNRFKERDLSDIIRDFGEERFHKRIARFIAEERSEKPITTTFELAAVIRRAAGARYSKQRIDPATRTFQAIRIFVNNELVSIEKGLKKAIAMLQARGRISAISFHSLEDRIVKNTFREFSHEGVLKILTKKPVNPSQDEIITNPRSRSAKLRSAERI